MSRGFVMSRYSVPLRAPPGTLALPPPAAGACIFSVFLHVLALRSRYSVPWARRFAVQCTAAVLTPRYSVARVRRSSVQCTAGAPSGGKASRGRAAEDEKARRYEQLDHGILHRNLLLNFAAAPVPPGFVPDNLQP